MEEAPAELLVEKRKIAVVKRFPLCSVFFKCVDVSQKITFKFCSSGFIFQILLIKLFSLARLE